ncbi:MAG TPA: glycerophosphodiester phosphodiesterase [Polyangiaceae bacterium]|jgi:glycerophosphoryl diester phosphodiesterase
MKRIASGAGVARPWRRRDNEGPRIFAHRGARFHAPENTLAAFELARRAGADGIELDVRTAADGTVVVFHDTTLTRMTGGEDRRRVAELDGESLSRVRLSGEPVPTLEDVLAWARNTPLLVNVELKRDVPRRAELVAAVGALLDSEPEAPERILLSSFDPAMVWRAARRAARVAVAWLLHDGQRLLRTAPGWSRLGARGVHLERTLLSRARVARLRRAGAFVNTWTVNSALEARRASELGVDAIITDVPEHLLGARASWPRARQRDGEPE